MAFYKKSIKAQCHGQVSSTAHEISERSKQGASFQGARPLCSQVRARIAACVFVAYLLISVAPIFSAVAPPIRRQAPATAADASNDTGSASDRIAAMEQKLADAQSAGDNAWMLVSSALVLLMTGPGLALFYGGLVRKKNVLGTMMQSFALMGLVTVLWAIFGYSLCFAPGNPFIGSLDYAFLHNVGGAPNPIYAATIPQQTFMIFQLMFAIITPGLIAGAFAERMKFSAMVIFTSIWFLIVYAPLAHMVWGQGGFLNSSGGGFPTLDFAGGTVVHISSGVSALVCALYLGKRAGYPREPMLPHSVVLSFIGACLLWVGWFGFNAGSALSAGRLASSAFVATHFGAAAAALGWAGVEWLRNGKPSALGIISGAVAGLVAITPASGFVGPMSALVIGLCAGVTCYLMVTKVRPRFGYDDSLDAFGVHGAGGTLGALLTGIFALAVINPVFHDAQGNTLPLGVLDGNGRQILNQLVGVLISWGLAIVGTLIALKVADLLVGVRISGEQEAQGLDLSQHGEVGYDFES
jgi:ammonium transporter, Amt family